MFFKVDKIPTQSSFLIEKLIRDELLDVRTSQRSKVANGIARLIERYALDFIELDNEVDRFLGEHQMDRQYRKRVTENLSKEKDFPIGETALDHLNEQIEEFFLESDTVDDVYADTRQLVAAVTPFLKAMAASSNRF